MYNIFSSDTTVLNLPGFDIEPFAHPTFHLTCIKSHCDSVDTYHSHRFLLMLFFLTLQIANKVMLESYQHGGMAELKDYIYSKMWYPNYRPLVHLPPGKLE